MSKELLQKVWNSRNPQHEINADTGEDMFWQTVIMVIEDYNAANKITFVATLPGRITHIHKASETDVDICERCGHYYNHLIHTIPSD